MSIIARYLFVVLTSYGSIVFAQNVHVTYSKKPAQQVYAVGVLSKALVKKGYSVNGRGITISLSIDNNQLNPEAFAIAVADDKIIIKGGDETGLIYGCQSIAEDLLNGIPLQKIKSRTEKPQYPFRAIKFDMPWDTYRHSYALDLHDTTCRDTAYWKAFLDMMANNRFNVLTLWNLHPYTYMIRAKNFPEATPFTDAELKIWHQLFTSIFRMAKERGIDTYLVPFNIFVSPQFAKAHNVELNNLQHDFYVNADTSEIIKRYTRESVTQVLNEYPDLTGFGLTLGEGMGGMTPQQREDWMKETIIKGMSLAGRKTKLIHRIPFSSGTASMDVTSIETEKLTRKEIDAEGDLDFLEKPIWADLKYNWSHAFSATKLVKVHGGKLFDTYFKPFPTAYKLIWTARNEDFFCLRWGDASFIRAHIATNSQPYTGGYMIGSETYIPAKDYFTKITAHVEWKYAFERQWLFYKLWGRLLYNPKTPDAIFKAEFVRRYGATAAPLLQAYSLASKTPLRLASSFDFTFDLTIYSEGFLANNPKTKSLEYISVDRQINQPPLDTNYISIANYVKTIVAGGSFSKEKITPPVLAAMLERDCTKALDLVKNIQPGKNNTLMYEVADVKIWANMGLAFAEKIKGGIALQQYRLKGNAADKQMAVAYLQKTLNDWDKVVAITTPIYKEMPLVHYTEQKGIRSKENYWLKFHWKNIRPDVAADVEFAKNAKVGLLPN
jgi:hypothetical protein